MFDISDSLSNGKEELLIELTAQGKIPITVAGEGHVELVKNMMNKNTKLNEFSLRRILKSIK